LQPRGDWDPTEEYWGEPGDPLPALWQEVIAAGVRPCFEMEQVLPGVEPDDWDRDPIVDAADLHRAGHHRDAVRLLEGLLAIDTPRRAAIFGPEPWATVARAQWCHFDRWFALVAATSFADDLDGLEHELVGRLRSSLHGRGDVEAKLSHLPTCGTAWPPPASTPLCSPPTKRRTRPTSDPERVFARGPTDMGSHYLSSVSEPLTPSGMARCQPALRRSNPPREDLMLTGTPEPATCLM
jgi:hypothetical protein